MKQRNAKGGAAKADDMPELGPDFFRRAVRGKYYRRATEQANVVRIAQDLTADFPNEAAVNRALRAYRRLIGAFNRVTQTSSARLKKSA